MSWRWSELSGWWDDESIYHQSVVDQWNAEAEPAVERTQPLDLDTLLDDQYERSKRALRDEWDRRFGDQVIDAERATLLAEHGAYPRKYVTGLAEGLDIADDPNYQALRGASAINWDAATPYMTVDDVRRTAGAGPGARGIDVSRYQGAPSWKLVREAGVEFAYVKASEGGSSSYPTTNEQFLGARAAGLRVGLYHFARPNLSATENADAFAAVINKLGPGDLPPCLDLEVGQGNLSAWCLAFFARLRERTAIKRVMLYSGAAFFRAQITESWMGNAPVEVLLWIAHYGRTPGQPGYLSPRVAIHQYSDVGQLMGITGDVDLNHAIWPLDKIITGSPDGEDDDMNDADRKMLAEVHATLLKPMKAWPGGSTGDPARDEYTLWQYILRSNVEQLQSRYAVSLLTRQVGELTATVATLLQALQGAQPVAPPAKDVRRGETVTRVAPDGGIVAPDGGEYVPPAPGDYPRGWAQ